MEEQNTGDLSDRQLLELMRRELGQLDTNVKETNTRLGQLETDVKETNARLTQLETDVKETNVRLTQLETDAKETNARLGQLEARTNPLPPNYDRRFTTLEADVREIKRDMRQLRDHDWARERELTGLQERLEILENQAA